MHRFFAATIPAAGALGRLTAEESRHGFRVLRIAVGERVELIDGAGLRACAEITAVSGGARRPLLDYRVLERSAEDPPRLRIRLCIAPPRPKAMAQIIQQATELGVQRISPVLCDFGVAKPTKQSSVEHWHKEAVSALKQSGNPWLPRLDAPASFDRCLSACEDRVVFGHCGSGCAARTSPPASGEVHIWVGPEGGFSEDEQRRLRSAGGIPVQLGPYILRVETAAIALLGWARGLT